MCILVAQNNQRSKIAWPPPFSIIFNLNVSICLEYSFFADKHRQFVVFRVEKHLRELESKIFARWYFADAYDVSMENVSIFWKEGDRDERSDHCRDHAFVIYHTSCVWPNNLLLKMIMGVFWRFFMIIKTAIFLCGIWVLPQYDMMSRGGGAIGFPQYRYFSWD